MNNIEQALPKMRTIRETAEITKPLGVSEFMLRRLVREKKNRLCAGRQSRAYQP